MHMYAVLVGTHPAISLAELHAVLPDLTVKHQFAGGYVIVETSAELDQKFLNTLGGTLLIAKSVTSSVVVSLEDIPGILATELAMVKGKATFALRCSGLSPKKISELYRTCKDSLKSKGVSSRYVGNERQAAMSVQLHDEGLLDPKKGCEIVILMDKENLWIGRTVAAQDIKSYSLRDMEKPVRDTTVGLLPPKLAQMLINLGTYLVPKDVENPKPQLTIFDPFTGTGVIPMESVLRGFNVVASDIEEKAMKGTKKNVEWLRKSHKINEKISTVHVWKQDAQRPFTMPEKETTKKGAVPELIRPDVIVTEGTLGRAFTRRPMLMDAKAQMKRVSEIIQRFLANASATLPKVPIVMTWPVWYTDKKIVTIEITPKQWEKLGYKFVLPPETNPSLPERTSLLYRRQDQFVGREIVMLKPVKKK